MARKNNNVFVDPVMVAGCVADFVSRHCHCGTYEPDHKMHADECNVGVALERHGIVDNYKERNTTWDTARDAVAQARKDGKRDDEADAIRAKVIDDAQKEITNPTLAKSMSVPVVDDSKGKK